VLIYPFLEECSTLVVRGCISGRESLDGDFPYCPLLIYFVTWIRRAHLSHNNM
jgi:hypothetical protein